MVCLRESKQVAVDLSINTPREIGQANCITARYDGGISNIPQYRTGVVVSSQASKFEKKIDIASTLLARDYKGLGNQNGNAIIEGIDNGEIRNK